MPPRTSLAPAASTDTTRARQSLKRKSLSTSALEQVEALLPPSCTPGYVVPSPAADASSSTGGRRKSVKGKGKEAEADDGKLTEEQKAALLVEILGFQPTELLQDITESARQQVDKTVLTIENWLSKVVRLSAAGGGAGQAGKGKSQHQEGELMLEVDQGLHGLETLLNDHMDAALDKLTSWALRNTFEIPDDLRLTLPWHEGLDFDRGIYVASLPEGETSVQKNIEELREQVENMRKLKHGLTMADRAVGEKVKAMQRQKDAIGFITTLASEAGISSLPSTAREITQQMDKLHASLSEEFDTVLPVPAPPPPTTSTTATGDSSTGPASAGGLTREWEFGRAAYLSWAVSRALRDRKPPAGSSTGTGMDIDAESPAGDAGDEIASNKRLDELVKLTRQVSGASVPPGGAGDAGDDGHGGAASGTGASGIGWALQSLVNSRPGSG